MNDIRKTDTFSSIVANGAGLMHGLPSAWYHVGPGLNLSGIKRFRKTPFHFRALANPGDAPPAAPTPAMLNGTLVHCATLEPAEFDKRYAIGPEISRNSNKWRDFVADHPGMEVITHVQYQAAVRQAAALRALPDVAALLEDGSPEVSAYWTDEATGILCKCRPDWVAPVAMGTGVILVDVKTASDASPEGFARSAADLGYHLQAAWYCEGYARASGLEVHGMVFAVVESAFPHAVAAYMLDDIALGKGHAALRTALTRFAECDRANSWPGYPAEIMTLQLPPWA